MDNEIGLKVFYDRLFTSISDAAQSTGKAIVSVNGVPIGVFNKSKEVETPPEEDVGEPVEVGCENVVSFPTPAKIVH